MSGFFLGGGTGGGTTGGGGYGYPFMGAFVRSMGGGSSGATTGEGGTTGSTSSGGGGGGFSDFYYDQWLELWVEIESTDTSFTCLFYRDQAKTQPAGHSTSTFTDDWQTYPQTYTSSYSFTAGTIAGAHGEYQCVQLSESEGSMTYNNSYPDGSSDEGQSSWSEQGANWSSQWSRPGGWWYQDEGNWAADGSGTYENSDSDGWSASWIYNADWSGSALLQGPDPKLPATMTWTSQGRYRIVYADGSEERWTWEDFWGDGSVGTTGGTSGSTSG
ncbi:MAG TPA: hypothetical protein VM328_01835 [Fimbriimonadaceae bacterium]|nr:hypothetical protein [Fimbriimonadaceae bacterium]